MTQSMLGIHGLSWRVTGEISQEIAVHPYRLLERVTRRVGVQCRKIPSESYSAGWLTVLGWQLYLIPSSPKTHAVLETRPCVIQTGPTSSFAAVDVSAFYSIHREQGAQIFILRTGRRQW